MRKILPFLLMLLAAPLAHAGSAVNPYSMPAGQGQLCLDIYTENGATKVYCPDTLKVTNGTLTDNGDGTASLSISAGSGTVTSVSVVSANGFAGSVATSTTTPAITLSTTITGLLKGNGTAISAAVSGTDYEVPLTFSTGLTRTTNTITVNTSQNIATLSNLTSNGFVKTSGGTGALSIDTTTYLSAVTADSPLSGSGTSGSHLVIANAAADGSTKGAASFAAADFDATTGNISLDYTNGQAASSSNKGFLTSTDWTTFNNKISQSGAQVYAADAGASDTYAITLSPVPSSYTTGMVIQFKANTANTGTASLNVNSLGAKTIVKQHDVTLADNDIESGQVVTVVYDGTNFEMQSQVANSAAGSGTITSVGSACSSGACDSITIADGQKIDLSGVTVNTTTEGLLLPTYNSGGTADKQISYDGTNDILYVGNGTNAAAINVLPYSSSGAGTSATRYTSVLGSLVSATETDVDNYQTPRSCIMQNLRCTIDVDPGGVGKSWDCTVRAAGAGTTLTANIANGTTTGVDTTHRPTVAADAKVDVEWLRNSTAASPGNMIARWECIPN